MMVLHGIIRLAGVIGAATAPILSALLCRSFSKLAVQNFIQNSSGGRIPTPTRIWILDVADGRFPMMVIALIISVIVLALGIYFAFSSRPAPATAITLKAAVEQQRHEDAKAETKESFIFYPIRKPSPGR